jgi:hypothetical protein
VFLTKKDNLERIVRDTMGDDQGKHHDQKWSYIYYISKIGIAEERSE